MSRVTKMQVVVLLTACLLLSALTIAASGQKSGTEQYNRGIALYKQKKPEAALEAFQSARRSAPNDPAILYWIGFLHLQAGRYSDALEPLERAVQLKSSVPEAHLNLGNVYDGLKRYDDAAREFETAARLQPKSADAYYNLGSAYYKLHRLPESVQAYRKAAALNPNDAYIQDGLGFALQSAGKLEESILAYRKSAQISPTNASFWLNLGLAQRDLARKRSGAAKRAAWLETRTALSNAVKLAPNDYGIREAYAESLFDSGLVDRSVAEFQKAVQLNPRQFPARFNLGMAQLKLNKPADAAKTFREALTIKPGHREALRNLGLALLRDNKPVDAEQTYQKLTETDPTDQAAWLSLSGAQRKKGDSDGALKTLEEGLSRAAKEGAKLSMLHKELGLRLFLKGDAESLPKAEEQFQQALKEDENQADAWNGLGLVCRKLNKNDEALAAFKRAVKLNPKDANASNNLGVAYEAKGDTANAIAAYRRALQLDPKQAQARKNLATLVRP